MVYLLFVLHQVFDKQGNNTVSVADIKHGLSSLGERLTEEEIDGLFREADPNAEGTCNINGEFLCVCVCVCACKG